VNLRQGMSSALAGLLGLAFVAGAGALMLLSGEEATTGLSVASTKDSGRRALFLVLQELGFEPSIWNQAPVALPVGEHTLWLSTPPLMGGPDEGEEESEEDQPATGDSSESAERDLADPRHPWNYGLFVRGGGTLVVPARQKMLNWLRGSADLDVPLWHGLSRAGQLNELTLDTDETLRVTGSLVAVEEQGTAADWHDLAWDGQGAGFAAWCEIGEGRVVLLAGDGFLSNAHLGDDQNALFAVRLLESIHRGGELLFDEYALGLWQPPSSVGLLAAPGLREVTLQVLLFVLCLLLFSSWSREFSRDPEALSMNPRLRAKAGARLYERAGRYDLLARELRLGVLRRMAGRWRMTRSLRQLNEDASAEDIGSVAHALALRSGETEETAARWARLFSATNEGRQTDFETLVEQLGDLETNLQTTR